MSHRKRTGFTLVELLVVIAIMTILISLVMAGVFAVRSKEQLTTTTLEIAEMKMALQNFRTRFGGYPPSQITLGTGADAESQRVLKLFWPTLNLVEAFGPNGLAVTGSPTLTGDQCLVLFLGGRHDASGCQGFSTSKSNPFAAGGDREKPFFNFKQARLYQRDPSSPFYSYGDGFFKTAYQGAVQFPCYAYFAPTRLTGYVDSHCNSLTDAKGNFPQPYKENVTTFVNRQSYQIISPGKDTLWGKARQWAPGRGVLDLADDPSNPDSQDNISDFAGGLLSGS